MLKFRAKKLKHKKIQRRVDTQTYIKWHKLKVKDIKNEN